MTSRLWLLLADVCLPCSVRYLKFVVYRIHFYVHSTCTCYLQCALFVFYMMNNVHVFAIATASCDRCLPTSVHVFETYTYVLHCVCSVRCRAARRAWRRDEPAAGARWSVAGDELHVADQRHAGTCRSSDLHRVQLQRKSRSMRRRLPRGE